MQPPVLLQAAAGLPRLAGLAHDALSMFARGDLESVIDGMVEAVRQVEGQTGQNYFMLGEARRLSGDPRRALEEYRLALPLVHDDEATLGAIYFSRGLCFMSIGEWYAAAEQFQSVPHPQPPEALVSAGTCARYLGDEKRALELFDTALKLDGEHSHARCVVCAFHFPS